MTILSRIKDALPFKRVELAPTVETALEERALYLERATEPRLMQVDLPEGDVPGINIGWWKNGIDVREPTWLEAGYDGIRFVGKGIGRTHMRCTSWDGITIAVRRHDGIVQFENMTIHCGYSRATALGEQNLERKIFPKFHVRFLGCEIVADPPDVYGGRRAYWGLFGYNCDLTLRECAIDTKHAVEHSAYMHNAAQHGYTIDGCHFVASGAEGFKDRGDVLETAWAGPRKWIVIRNTTFEDWYQPHSWRGGAGIVLQGSAAHVLIERCKFYGGGARGPVPSNQRSKAIMVSSEGSSLGHGQPDSKYGNGFVIIRQCAAYGQSEVQFHNTMIRCARNGGGQQSARGLLIEDCGLWGENMIVQVGNLDRGKFLMRGCNTPSIKYYCDELGMLTDTEARFPTSDRLVPVSEGVSR